MKEILEFLDRFFKNLEKVGIDVLGYECDHIGYQASSLEKYKEAKARFSKLGECYEEEIVNGRPISFFRFKNSIEYKNHKIPILELLAPKKDSNFSDGPEHAEFVVPDLKGFMKQYQDIKFEKQNLVRKNNPELILKFSDCAVKFHPIDVVEASRLYKETGEL